MFDYLGWMTRAREFIERMRDLPGDVRLEIDISPPISREEVESLLVGVRPKKPKPTDTDQLTLRKEQ